MATVKEWREEINKLSPEEAERKAKALTELSAWEFFDQEFKGTGLNILYFALTRRGKEG